MTVSEQGTETIVALPALGESVEEGTVSRWLVDEGDRIAQGEPLLEVATDKVDTEIPAPCSGVVARILAEANAVVAVGEALAVITCYTDVPAPPTEPPTPTVTSVDDDRRARPEPPAVTEKLTRIRRTIARRMVESLQTAAQLTTVVEVDVTAVARLRAAYKADFQARTGTKLSFLPFFAKAAVEALTAHPMLNASINADITEVTYHGVRHLGMAVDSPKGLMVPVIRDAAALSIAELAVAIADAADKVRTGSITADELAGGTFTLTNTGSVGALFDTPIINAPQTGILGTGAVTERLVPFRDDTGSLRIEARSMAYFSLSYDHRLVDGADAARFLGAVKARLQNGFDPSELC